MKIRKAKIADLDALVAMGHNLLRLKADGEPIATTSEGMCTLVARVLSDPNGRVFLAIEKSKPIAMFGALVGTATASAKTTGLSS